MSTIALQANELGRLLQGSHARTGIRAVNLLLVIWIAAQCADLTWNLLPQARQSPLPVAVSTEAARVENPHLALIDTLPELHLMGIPGNDAPAVESAPVDAPDTQLKLILRGALASEDKEHARAIIADSGGKEEQYAIGDTVPGNAELSEIFPDRVILQRAGRYETLRLPTDSGPAGFSSASLTARSMPAARAAQVQSPADRLRALRSQLKTSPRSLYGMIRATPREDESGKIFGYVVAPGNDPELFNQLGLQDGDVVTEVNSLSMSDPASGAAALKSLQSGEQVVVKLLRNGVEQTVTLEAPN